MKITDMLRKGNASGDSYESQVNKESNKFRVVEERKGGMGRNRAYAFVGLKIKQNTSAKTGVTGFYWIGGVFLTLSTLMVVEHATIKYWPCGHTTSGQGIFITHFNPYFPRGVISIYNNRLACAFSVTGKYLS